MSGCAPRPADERISERLVAVEGPLSSPCLAFQGAQNSNGYGQIGVGSRTDGTRRIEYVHRLVYEHAHGAIPDGLEVCHRCDNRICCEPSHLYVGTRSRNARDCVERGRHYSPFGKTERTRHGLEPAGTARRIS